ncbi:MAG TPA: WD40 repeat domain-containing protein, partial [Pirellulales bacterium]
MIVASCRNRTNQGCAVAQVGWLVLGAWIFLASTAAAEPPADDKALVIQATPLPFAAGEPLCRAALVQRPAALKGLVSWTIETRRHRGGLESMALSPDGKLLATGGSDATIHVWDLASGKLVRILVAEDDPIRSLSWSPDGKVLAAAGSFEKTLRLWNAETGLLLRTFTDFKDFVALVRWSPDGRRLAAAGGFSGWIWSWDVASDRAALLTELGQPVIDLDWSPDNSRLAVAIIATPVSVIDAATGKNLQSFGDARAMTYCARWSPDGSQLAIGDESAAALYAMPQASLLWKRPGISWGAAWSPNGRRLAMVRTDGVHIMMADGGQTDRKLPDRANSLLWHTADSLLLRHPTTVSQVDPITGKPLVKRWIAGTRPPIWSTGRPIVSGLATKTLHLWDRVTAAKSWVLTGHTAAISGVAWQNDGDVLASAAWDKTIRLWDAKSGKLLHVVKDLPEPALHLAWSPDGKTLASSGMGRTVRLTGAAGE